MKPRFNDAGERFKNNCRLGCVMQHLAEAFAECALARYSSAGMIFAKTSDGMEWAIRYEQMGVRNAKTGRIDKRLRAKP